MFIFSVNKYQPVKYITPQVEHIRQVPLQTGGSKENTLYNIIIKQFKEKTQTPERFLNTEENT